MKITRKQIRSIIREANQQLIAESKIRRAVRSALLKESWVTFQPQEVKDRMHMPGGPEDRSFMDNDYYKDSKAVSSDYKGRLDHVASGNQKYLGMYIRMQLQDVDGAGLNPEELEQLESLKASDSTGHKDLFYMYPAILDILPDFHDPASQEKFRKMNASVMGSDLATKAKQDADREEFNAKERARAGKPLNRNKSGSAYDTYLNSVADMQNNMDAVDELAGHVNSIADAGGSVGEMAEDFIEEILRPAIQYNDDDINDLLRQLDGKVKDAIMKKFKPSSNAAEGR